VSTNAAAAGVGALDGAAPALGVAVLGGEFGDLLVVDEDGLGVVASRVVVLVCSFRSDFVCTFCRFGDFVGRYFLQCMVTRSPTVASVPSV